MLHSAVMPITPPGRRYFEFAAVSLSLSLAADVPLGLTLLFPEH